MGGLVAVLGVVSGTARWANQRSCAGEVWTPSRWQFRCIAGGMGFDKIVMIAPVATFALPAFGGE
ncbi:MAG: hypothetical protein FWD57_01600 [Polyangiaceae bacterium]|nr:hypothetical protein [Polyangiaceae bacterium]